MNKIDLKSNTNNNIENIAREIFNKNKKIQGAKFSIIQGEYDVVGGSISRDSNQSDETLLEKFFSGESSIIATWDNSRILKLREDFPEEDYAQCIADNGDDSMCPKPQDLIKELVVGDLEDFYIDAEEYGIQQREAGSAETSSRIKLFSRNPIDTQELWKLRVFPSLNNFMYRIIPNGAKVQRNEKGDVVYVEYTFEKITRIKNILDIDQVLQLQSSIGEGYAWPKVQKYTDDKGNEVEQIILDEERLKNTPIKYLQIDFADPSAISSYYAVGRPSTQGSVIGEIFDEPRILAPSKFYQQDGNKIQGNVAPSDVFIFTKDARITIQSGFKNWIEKVQSKYRPNSKKQWSGVLTDIVKNAIEFSDGSIEGSVLTLNTDVKYWDQEQRAFTEDVKYNALSPFVDQENGFTIPVGTLLRYEDLMMHNIFGFSSVLTLPMEYSESAPYSLAKIGSVLSAVVGGVAGGVIAGSLGAVGGGWLGSLFGYENIKTDANKVNDLRLFIGGSNYASMWNGIYGVEESNIRNDIFPIDFFSENRETTMMGIADSYTSMKAELSDKYTNDNGETIYSFKDLGKDLDGDGIPDRLWDGKNLIVNIEDENWFLDLIVIQAIAETEYFITAYNYNNEAIQSFKGITTSKRTGNLRNWTTLIKTSNWLTNVKIVAPDGDPIIPPKPDALPELTITLNKTFETNETFTNEIPNTKILNQTNLDDYLEAEEYEEVLNEVLVDTDTFNNFELTFGTEFKSKKVQKISWSYESNNNIKRQIFKELANDYFGDANKASAPFSNAQEEPKKNINDSPYSESNNSILDEEIKLLIPRSQLNKEITLDLLSIEQAKQYAISENIIPLTNDGINSFGYVDSINTEKVVSTAGLAITTRNPGVYSNTNNFPPKITIKLSEFIEGDFVKLKIKVKLNKSIFVAYNGIEMKNSAYSSAMRIKSILNIKKIRCFN